MNKDVANYFTLGLSQAIKIAIAIPITMLTTRLLSPEEMGKVAMFAAVSTFLYSFCINWIQSAGLRFGKEEWTLTKSLSETWSTRWPILLIGFILIILMVAFQPLNWMNRLAKLPETWNIYILLNIFAIWITSEASIFMQIKNVFFKLALLPVCSSLCLLIYYSALLKLHSKPDLKLIYFLFGSIITSIIFYLPIVFAGFAKSKIKGHLPRKETIAKSFSYSWPLIPTFFLGYISDWGDQWLLQHFYGIKNVGLFQIAYSVMLSFFLLAAPLSTILTPRLIGNSVLNPSSISLYITKYIPTIAILWALLIIPTIAFVPYFFYAVVGHKYIDALPIFLILLVAVPGAAFSQLYSTIYNVQGRLMMAGGFHAVMIIVNIGLTLLFYKLVGPLGSAIGSAASYIVIQGLYIGDQHRYLKIPMIKMLTLFILLLIFSIIQIFAKVNLLHRFILCVLTCLLTILYSRLFLIADKDVLDKLFPNNIGSALFSYLLVAPA